MKKDLTTSSQAHNFIFWFVTLNFFSHFYGDFLFLLLFFIEMSDSSPGPANLAEYFPLL